LKGSGNMEIIEKLNIDNGGKYPQVYTDVFYFYS